MSRDRTTAAPRHRVADAPIRRAVHILFPDYLALIKDGKPLSDLEHLNQAARQMLDVWTAVPKARERSLRRAA
jgi:hypothetical protein